MKKSRNLHVLAHKLSGEKLDKNKISISKSNILWRSNKPLDEILNILKEIQQAYSNILNMSDNKQTTIKFIHKEYRPSFYTVKKLIIPTETKVINSLDSKIGLKLLQKRNNPFMNQDYIIRTTTRAKNIITRTKMIESRQNQQLRFYDISKEEQVRVHIFKVPNKD